MRITGSGSRPFLAASLLMGLGTIGCIGEIGGTGGGVEPGPVTNPPITKPDPMVTPAMCANAAPSAGVAPLKRLTRSQYNNTIRDLLGITTSPATSFAADEKVGPFFSNSSAPVSELLTEQFLNAAESLADTVTTTKLATVAPCDLTKDDQALCGSKFVDSFGLRAFRRPLTTQERASMVALFESGRATTEGYAEGIHRVVQAMLQMPQFLYQMELGVQPAGAKDVVALDPYIVASRLSFYLWDSTPDSELLRAAGAGELTTPATLRAQATRLLKDDRAASTIASFHRQWLGMDALGSLEKDQTVYPAFTTPLRDAMAAETDRFTDYVIRNGDGKLETLLTAPFSFVQGPLATLYGVKASTDATKPIDLNPAQRGGLLTQASVLSIQSHAEQSSPIRRGKMIREQFFCQTLSPPPPGVDLTPPMLDPNIPTRERFEKHRTAKECAACHALIDPIGFGFENYDGIGAYRAMEAGKAVDASGELTGTDVDGTFNGVQDLSRKLASSDMVRGCVAQKWFNFSLGRTAGAADACSMTALAEAFKKTNNVRDLLVELVATDAFRYGHFEKGAP